MFKFKLEIVKDIFRLEKLKFYEMKKRTKVKKIILALSSMDGATPPSLFTCLGGAPPNPCICPCER